MRSGNIRYFLILALTGSFLITGQTQFSNANPISQEGGAAVTSSDPVADQSEKPSPEPEQQEEKQNPESPAEEPKPDASKEEVTESKPSSKPDEPQVEVTGSKSENETADKSESPKTEAKPARKVTPRDKTTTTKTSSKKQIRWLALSGSYEDQTSGDSFDPTSLLLGTGPRKAKSFYNLCNYLEELESEEQLTCVVFDLSDSGLAMNLAQLDELTRRMAKLKSKGKKTIAWLETADNTHLAIASQCDDIIIADLGAIDMPSTSMETMFYRDAMDLVGIKAAVVRAGDFKGAVEPYLYPSMSEHLKGHYLSMMESLNAARVSRIAKGRGLTTAAVRDLQKKRILMPSDALAAGLVTRIAPFGSMKQTIEEIVGKDLEWSKPKAKPKREISLFELISKSMSSPKEASTKVREDSIVVLHLQGAIVDGKSTSPGSIVSGPTVKQIEELASDDRVRGVVVRVNSPGGSATASEAIRQSLAVLAKKKPVVFSMGEVAASGGYWVTCIGQPIYAEHGTITGSIGVFSMRLSFGSLLRRVGVHVESIALDPAASLDAIDRNWTEEELASLQRFVDQIYDKFIHYASESRKLPLDKVKSLAGGRVWSGEQAKTAGLIDELGGLDDTLAAVAKRAQITNYKVLHRPERPAGLGIFSLLGEDDEDSIDSYSIAHEVELLWSQKLESIGFRLDGLKTLLKYTERNQNSVPQVWALMPEELKVK